MNLSSSQDPLNAPQKEALRLREAEGLTYREIALLMGVSHHRIQQLLAEGRARRRDCAENGEEALCLLPKRVHDVLQWHQLTRRAELCTAFESGRLMWDPRWKRAMLDGKNLRNLGWKSWQVMCEWAGQPVTDRSA